MRVSFVKLMGATALCLLMAMSASAQQEFHQLSSRDFWGTPQYNNSRGVVAYTNCTIDYRYIPNRERDGYRLSFNIRLILNNSKSWIDRDRVTSPQMMAEILKHEQGHYTIAYLEQQELLRVVGNTRFSNNYNNEAMAIFNRIDAKYKQLNTNYDEDTQHMTNRVQQHSWDLYFQQKLKFLPENEEAAN